MLLERSAELSALRSAVDSAVAGNGRVVVVSGDAGIGKTSLLRAFHSECTSARVYWGSSDALFTPQPLGPLRDFVAKLDRNIAELIERREPLDKILTALLAVLQDARSPNVLIFEDAHWADNSTLDLIKYLGRRIAFVPCVLILSVRTDDVGRDHSLTAVLGELPPSAVVRLSLAPLSFAAISTLSNATELDARALHALTGGNPFFASELIAHGSKSGNLPVSVRDTVWARLQRLPHPVRALLEAISVSPSGAETWFAEALHGQPVEGLLHDCVSHGFLTESRDEKFRFRHELARVATEERLPASKQRSLHRTAFEVLMARQSLSLGCLLHHAAGAGLGSQVLALAPQAAAEAVKLGSHREASIHLATALKYASDAPASERARLSEEWAYQASLVQDADDGVMSAMNSAILLWRSEGNKKGVSRCLRQLSRLHWLRGEGGLANQCASDAVDVLDGEEPSKELAMAYGVRGQLLMFNDRFDEAISWSRKAITLAEQFGDTETRVHALNNLGHSLLYQSNDEGRAQMDKCLELAIAHGLQEQVNRAYINYGEYAVVAREFALADHLLADGIAYATRHDLDFGLYYLLGRQAQLRMDQGRFVEAEEIASRIVAQERLTVTVRFPSRVVLAKTAIRVGKTEGLELMQAALRDALLTEEQQNIFPTRIGLVEAAWLSDDMASAQSHLKQLLDLQIEGMAAWDVGEFAVWWQRCAMEAVFPFADKLMLLPQRLERAGDYLGAAAEWDQLGLPYEAVLSLMSAVDGLKLAASRADELGTAPAAARARLLAGRAGIVLARSQRQRGPYGVARKNPLGLTGREIAVLDQLRRGKANSDIAAQLTCSRRTVEHHVSAILAKFDATNRTEIILRLHNEPWLMAGAGAEI